MPRVSKLRKLLVSLAMLGIGQHNALEIFGVLFERSVNNYSIIVLCRI